MEANYYRSFRTRGDIRRLLKWCQEAAVSFSSYLILPITVALSIYLAVSRTTQTYIDFNDWDNHVAYSHAHCWRLSDHSRAAHRHRETSWAGHTMFRARFSIERSWESKGITSLQAISVCHPRGMRNEPDENWIIIASEYREIGEIHPMYVKPIPEPVALDRRRGEKSTRSRTPSGQRLWILFLSLGSLAMGKLQGSRWTNVWCCAA